MRYFSRKDIEQISKRVIRAYEKQANVPKGPLRWVDPDVLSKDLLGLTVVYETLSLDQKVLGATAYSPVGIRIFDDNGKPDFFFVDGKTLLIDKSLLAKNAIEGRHNFTLIHEASHQIYKMLFPSDYSDDVKERRVKYSIPSLYYRKGQGSQYWEEWKTNILASALILPEEYLRYNMSMIGMHDAIRILDPVYDPSGYRLFCELAAGMHVSKQALAIRMKGLGLLKENYLQSPGASLNIWKDDDEDF